MKDQFGNEINIMTKEEAKASVDEMSRMMDYFEGTCEFCGNKRMHCPMECIDKQLSQYK